FTDKRTAKDSAHSSMTARKHDHRIGEDATKESPVIEVRKPIRCVLEIAAKSIAPPSFIGCTRAIINIYSRGLFVSRQEQRIGQQVGGFERVINTFTGYWIGETGGVANQRPTFSDCLKVAPACKIERRNLRAKECKTLGGRHHSAIIVSDEIAEQR